MRRLADVGRRKPRGLPADQFVQRHITSSLCREMSGQRHITSSLLFDECLASHYFLTVPCDVCPALRRNNTQALTQTLRPRQHDTRHDRTIFTSGCTGGKWIHGRTRDDGFVAARSKSAIPITGTDATDVAHIAAKYIRITSQRHRQTAILPAKSPRKAVQMELI